MKTTSAQIREYAAEISDGDDNPAAILVAIREAQSTEEIEHLGRALLERNEVLADAPYRFGGQHYDVRLAAIAAALRWEA